MTDAERIRQLTDQLSRASRAYYMQDTEIMSNYEYDALYDELKALEEKTGIVLAGSPTQQVGYEVLSELPKEAHDSPMLSLDKTKDVAALQAWMGEQKAVLSWKMDGLTVVLTYEGGRLVKAVTRGNGQVGEVITPNAMVFKNVPRQIAFQGRLVLRGEAIIHYSDFNEINSRIPEGEMKYKNPRNLCSGSVRQLNNEITAQRNVYLYAFSLVTAEDVDFGNSAAAQFDWLESQGFTVVEHVLVDAESVADQVAAFSERIAENDFPSDGLVLLLEDIAYGESLGATAKFPRNAIAFKWADETKETHLLEVEWSASRTGLINPIAVFEPVELEGTTVSRASLHNISILRSLQLGIGDELQVYKANMIIPQIADNLTRSDTLAIPDRCPVCGQPVRLQSLDGVQTLYCDNPACQAKHVKRFAHMAGRDALGIDGLSEATLEKFIQKGFLHEYADLFRISRFRDEIIQMEGFGQKSFEKLTGALDKARHTSLPKLLFSLGIPNVGLSGAKLICRYYNQDLDQILRADEEELTQIEGVGPVIAHSFCQYFADPDRRKEFEDLLSELTIEKEEEGTSDLLAGKTFVITGSVNHFKNRNEMKAAIEKAGGKTAGSVSAKTSYLVNNDIHSASSKNKKAKELGVAIITEEELLAMMNNI